MRRPDVPTLAEIGCPEANLVSLFGIFAPAHTPAGVVHRLNVEINRALQNRTLREQSYDASNIPASGSPEDFASEIVADWQRNERLIAGSRVDGVALASSRRLPACACQTSTTEPPLSGRGPAAPKVGSGLG